MKKIAESRSFHATFKLRDYIDFALTGLKCADHKGEIFFPHNYLLLRSYTHYVIIELHKVLHIIKR